MTPQLGKMLIGLGIFLIIAGVFVLYRDRIPGLKFLGSLPGDIKITKGNTQFYFPLATSILLSVVISFILWFFRRG